MPFYIALPFTSFDPETRTGAEVPIEERSAEEVTHMQGITEDGARHIVRVVNPGSPAANPAFDMTPARLITGYITERGLLDVKALAGAAA